MRPAVCTRSRSGATTTAATAIISASVAASARVASVTRIAGAGGETVTQKGHHVRHLGQESSLASSKRRVALLEGSICNIGRLNDGRGFVGRQSVKETLSNKISHSGGSVRLVSGLLMKDIASIGQGTKVALGVSEMVKHGGPGPVDKRASVPETEILLENGLASKDDVC